MNYQLAVTRATKLQKQITHALQSLSEANAGEDIKNVEKALEDSSKIGSPDLVELIEQAKKRKTFLYEKNQLRDVLKTALESNNEGLLSNAIERAVKGGHFKLTDEEIRPGREKLDVLKQERILREQELAAAKAAAEEEERMKLEEEKRRILEEERRRREEEEDEKRRIEEEKLQAIEEEARRKREAEEKLRLEDDRKKKRRRRKDKKRRRRTVITRRTRKTEKREYIFGGG